MKVVVIPATYNEKGNIERLITILEEEVFPKIKNHQMSILVADDNSPDGTGDEVRKLMKKWNNLFLNQGERKGLGAAYVRAMTYAIEKMEADIVCEIDADLSHDPREIPNFIKKIDSGSDIVVGTRYSSGGSLPKNWPFIRKVFSVSANIIVRIVTGRIGIHDWTGGFRTLRKEVFLKEKQKIISYQGYTFQVAFLFNAVMDGYRVGEVPIHFVDRTLGRSKIAPMEYIINLLTYVITARIRELIFGKFGKFLVVGGFGFVINAVTLRILVEYSNWDPSYANLVGAALAIFSNYNFNNLWTFRHKRIKSFGLYFWKMLHFYMTSSFGVIFIQTGTIFVLSRILGKENYFIYFLIGTFFLLIWNFTIYNRFIWKETTPSK